MKKAFIGYLSVWTGLLAVKVPLGLFGDESPHSSLPLDPAPVAHLLGFALLSCLALAAQWPISRWSVLGLLVAYAVGTELMQAVLPWRSAELADLLLDVAGILVGGAIYWWLRAPTGR